MTTSTRHDHVELDQRKEITTDTNGATAHPGHIQLEQVVFFAGMLNVVADGSSRHLPYLDPMLVGERTGARWGLKGAEAVLKLRALRSNGDFDDYFAFHTRGERHRINESRHADGVIPAAA